MRSVVTPNDVTMKKLWCVSIVAFCATLSIHAASKETSEQCDSLRATTTTEAAVATAAEVAATSAPTDTTALADTTATTTEPQTFKLFYVRDEIVVREDYLDNAEQMRQIREHLASSPHIDSITIRAYASPEGAFRHNRYLSQQRAVAARDFILQNASGRSDLSEENIRLCPMDENWEGLREAVEQNYHRHDRARVLAIIDDDRVGPQTKKWRLEQLDGGYTWKYLLRKYMQRLRYATWVCIWESPEPEPEPEPVPRPEFETVPEVAPIAYTPTFEAPQTDISNERRSEAHRKRTILALKTNMLYDAVSVLNFAVEFPINEHFSVLYEHHCPWWLSKNNRYCLEYLTFGGEFRWWFAPRVKPESEKRKLRDALVGHFLGVYGYGGKFDFQAKTKMGCVQGDPLSFGLTYGYSLPVSRYLNIEFSISAGYVRVPYQHYIPTPDWQILIRDRDRAGVAHYFGPTKAEISLVIPIRANFKVRDTATARIKAGKKGGER